jgi:hypothetical protein
MFPGSFPYNGPHILYVDGLIQFVVCVEASNLHQVVNHIQPFALQEDI